MKNKIDKKLPKSEADMQLSEIDKALGLDNDDEMFMPDIGGFQQQRANPFAGNQEDDDLAAAIAASLAEMNQPSTDKK